MRFKVYVQTSRESQEMASFDKVSYRKKINELKKKRRKKDM